MQHDSMSPGGNSDFQNESIAPESFSACSSVGAYVAVRKRPLSHTDSHDLFRPYPFVDSRV
jgi:hypothetical protein